jgi:hypothetical protein
MASILNGYRSSELGAVHSNRRNPRARMSRVPPSADDLRVSDRPIMVIFLNKTRPFVPMKSGVCAELYR